MLDDVARGFGRQGLDPMRCEAAAGDPDENVGDAEPAGDEALPVIDALDAAERQDLDAPPPPARANDQPIAVERISIAPPGHEAGRQDHGEDSQAGSAEYRLEQEVCRRN